MITKSLKYSIELGIHYLLSQFKDGLFKEFYQLRHGPSTNWVTACIGSTLAEFKKVPNNLIDTLLKKQCDNGGWSYNEKVLSDADTTLRVLQFFNKVGYCGKEWYKGENFVITHQQKDGGISTYTKEAVEMMGYQAIGWTVSHPCVSALAGNVLKNNSSKEKINSYIANQLRAGNARSYWWKTPYYVLYEYGKYQLQNITEDPVDISLYLLLLSKLGQRDMVLVSRLADLQFSDGSFPMSYQFQIPRPNQELKDITGKEEVVADRHKLFSTAASIIALYRQTQNGWSEM